MKNQAFTLIEVLIVVLIIGILAAIAMPQYKFIKIKTEFVSIRILMKKWYDGLAEWKLARGTYCKGTFNDGSCRNLPSGNDLDAKWPSDWRNGQCGERTVCYNDNWYCFANTTQTGLVECDYTIGDASIVINMYQPDDENEEFRGKTIIKCGGGDGQKICKKLGKKFIKTYQWADYYEL